MTFIGITLASTCCVILAALKLSGRAPRLSWASAFAPWWIPATVLMLGHLLLRILPRDSLIQCDIPLWLIALIAAALGLLLTRPLH